MSNQIYFQNKKFLIKAVKQNGEVLADIPKEFKDDKDIVLAATEQYPLALQYASQKWRKDKNIITKLIRNNPCVIWAVPDECLEDTDFIIQLIQINQAVWHELPSTIQKQISMSQMLIWHKERKKSLSRLKSKILKKTQPKIRKMLKFCKKSCSFARFFMFLA